MNNRGDIKNYNSLTEVKSENMFFLSTYMGVIWCRKAFTFLQHVN